MSKPQIKMVVQGKGVEREGELTPSAGTTLEFRFNKTSAARLGLDYRDPDMLRLALGGEFEVRVAAGTDLAMKSMIERSLLDGKTSFAGEIRLEFPKDVSVEVTTDLGPESKAVAAKVTLRF